MTSSTERTVLGVLDRIRSERKRENAATTTPEARDVPATATTGQRFTDNGDGTVTDHRTRLVWLRDASCFERMSWSNAVAAVADLESGSFDLTDRSEAGAWRMPQVWELYTLIDKRRSTAFDGPFANVQTSSGYWTATPDAGFPGFNWTLKMVPDPAPHGESRDGTLHYVWPVRDLK